MLKVKGVTKTYGTIVALSDVSFEAGKGDFVFVTGPSGSGKTTLLRLILKDISPDKGKIVLDGKDIGNLKRKEIPAYRQGIGMVFQDFRILLERTVRENIEVALAIIRAPKDEWDKRVNEVLEVAGLGDRKDLFPSQLSGGEIQRVSLARALVVDPKIILADEPTGNLDWETAEGIMELFEKINKKGKTVIVATHHELIVEKHGGKLNRKVVKLEKPKKKRVETKDKEVKKKS